MDRKSIIVIILCLALLVSWGWLRDAIFPPTTVPVPTNQLSSATNVSMSAATNQSGAPPVFPMFPAPSSSIRKFPNNSSSSPTKMPATPSPRAAAA
jgi:hypothetical protein